MAIESRRFLAAATTDLEAVSGLMRRYYAEDGYPYSEARTREALVALVSDAALGQLWVAREGGRVVGYLAVTLGFSLEYGGRDAFLDELYIEPGHRGMGIGREALAIAEAYCREAGAGVLHLEVERHRTIALELYARAGFESHDRFLMTKSLADGPAE